MKVYFEEISNFVNKAKSFSSKLVELRKITDSELSNVREAAFLAGINENEIDSLIYYLKRGEVIETDTESQYAKLTLYGHLMLEGKIKNGYAPL